MKTKKIIALILACMMLLTVFAGCSSADVEETKPAAQEAVEGEASAAQTSEGKRTKLTLSFTPFESINPYNTTGAPVQVVGKALFEPLLCEYEGEVMGVIAKSWEWKDDYTVSIEIYDYIHDNAGNPITADDVVFSYNTWKAAAVQAENIAKVTDCVKTGDYSVDITLSEKNYPSFLGSALGFAIVSQAAYEELGAEGFATAAVGTGGYVVKEFSSSSYLVVEKVADHWQTDDSLIPEPYKARVDVLRFDMLSETEQIKGALESGTIQLGTVDAMVSMEFEGNPELGVVKVPQNYASCIVLNGLEGPLVDNLALRQAILYAIDIDTLAYGMSMGTGHAAYTIGSENLVGYNPEWETDGYYNFDVEAAKAKLAEAGYKEGELTLTILAPSIPGMDMLAQLIQANLGAIGINVEIDLPDNASYMARRNAYAANGWDICCVATVPKGYMINALATIADCGVYNNGKGCILGFYDEELDSLHKAALADATNVEKLSALHQWIEDNAWAYGLAVAYNFYGIDSNIEEVIFSVDGELCPNATVLGAGYDVFAE